MDYCDYIYEKRVLYHQNWDLSGVLMPEKSFSHVPPDNYNTENSDKRKLPLQTKEELLIPCGLEIPDLDLHSDIQFNWYLPDII